MTGLPPEPTGRGGDLLGVAAGADAAAIRAALLRRLEEADFVPPPEWLRAYESLGGGRLPAGEDRGTGPGVLAAEEELRDEVEAFALRFFTWPVAERRRLWQGLVERCAPFPPLAARVRDLGAGLLLDPGAVQDRDPRVPEVAGYVGELFVLRPAARAARRQELLARMKGDIARWEAAARSLEKQHIALADLEPELVGRLSRWTATRQELARARKRASKAARPVAPAQSSGRHWPTWLILGVVAGVVRAATCTSHYPSTYQPPPPLPKWDRPIFPQDPNGQLPEVQQQFRDALEQLRKRKPGAFGPEQRGQDGHWPPAVLPPDNPPLPEAVPEKAVPP